MTETRAILRAAAIAAEAHAGQERKHGLGPYIQHPFKVADMAVAAHLPAFAVQAALLHDVLEDCDQTARWRLEIAKLGDGVLPLVEALTKWWTNSDPKAAEYIPEYYRRITAAGFGADVKLLDRTDNLNDMLRLWPQADAGQRRWIRKYLVKTQAGIVPLREAATSPVAIRLFDEKFLAVVEAVGASA